MNTQNTITVYTIDHARTLRDALTTIGHSVELVYYGTLEDRADDLVFADGSGIRFELVDGARRWTVAAQVDGAPAEQLRPKRLDMIDVKHTPNGTPEYLRLVAGNTDGGQ